MINQIRTSHSMAAANKIRIAIQGSGIAGATCGHLLSKNANYEVTVFESGRGPGGRMSTRRFKDQYQWDHGAQYFSPKSEAFANVIRDDWCPNGLAGAWDANHYHWAASAPAPAPVPITTKNTRYVGTPGMNAICKGLLKNVHSTRCGARANAKRNNNIDDNKKNGVWTLTHAKSGELLGNFDFLICTDKTSAMYYRTDFGVNGNGKGTDVDGKRLLSGFIKPASAIRSVPSLAIMVVTKGPTNIEFDSLTLEDNEIFSWIARDSSKPGRKKQDNSKDGESFEEQECWVAHTSSTFTRKWINEFKKSKSRDFRAAIIRDLVPEFRRLVKVLSNSDKQEVEIIVSQGHRWGAAFPLKSFNQDSINTDFPDTSSYYLDADNSFAACGDYFTHYPGRVEGGWISGSELANALLDTHNPSSPCFTQE